MAIQVKCPTCEKVYNLRDNQAGAKVICRNCAEQFMVPGGRAPEQSPVLDALSAETVPSIRKPRKRSSDKSSNGESMAWVWILLGIGGAILLLGLGGCSGIYFLMVKPAQEKFEKAQEELGDPKSIDVAIARLNKRDRVKETAIWLRKQDVVKDKQVEAGRALAKATIGEDPFFNKEVYLALDTWATREQVPLLRETAQTQHFDVQAAAISALIRLRDPRSVAVLVKFRDQDGKKASIDEAIRAMMAEDWKVTFAGITAALAENNDTQKHMAEFLASQPVDPSHQAEIAAALANALSNTTWHWSKDPLTKALRVWGTQKELPVLLKFGQ